MTATSSAATRRARARRGLAVYLGVVIGVSAGLEGAMIADGRPIREQAWRVFALMWTPALAMLVARVALREGVRDVSFRLGLGRRDWREWLIAWLYPALAGGLSYGAAWASGLAPFHGDAGSFAIRLAQSLTIVTVFAAITATGEELGWRGYMLTRLVDAGVKRPLLVSGLIWGAWHLPLILSGEYAAGSNRWLSALLFAISVTAAGYVVARVRLASGSIWPAVLFHSSWNAVIQGTFDVFVAGHGTAHASNVWVGESGVIVVGVNVVLAVLLCTRPFPVRRYPTDPDVGEASIARS